MENKNISIPEILDVFKSKNVSLQKIRYIVEELKRNKIIVDCSAPNTYRLLK
jgi:hypothetical protein